MSRARDNANTSIFGTPSVTLGSDATGDVYYRAAGGALTRLPTTADGHVLTSTGVGAVPAFEALPDAGTMVLTGEQTWNGSEGSKFLNGCFSATYKSYWIVGHFYNPSSNGHGIGMQWATALNTALEATNYEWSTSGQNTSGTAVGYEATSAAEMKFKTGMSVPSNGIGTQFMLFVTGTHEALGYPQYCGTMLSGDQNQSIMGRYTVPDTTVTGLRGWREADAHVQGFIKVFGIKD